MPLSLEQLLSICRNYWPTSNESYLRQEPSPEHERLYTRWEQELKKLDRWREFLDALRGELPDFTVGDATAPAPDASFRCVVYSGKAPPRRFALVGCVSILAPVYMVYGLEFENAGPKRTVSTPHFEPLPADMRTPADLIARKLEAMFGAEPLPRQLAETPVPLFIEWMEPPATTLFHALFTSRPRSVP